MSTFWLIIKALAVILPAIINAIRDGRIRTAAQDEVLTALTRKIEDRLNAAKAVKQENLPDESLDPNNRSR